MEGHMAAFLKNGDVDMMDTSVGGGLLLDGEANFLPDDVDLFDLEKLMCGFFGSSIFSDYCDGLAPPAYYPSPAWSPSSESSEEESLSALSAETRNFMRDIVSSVPSADVSCINIDCRSKISDNSFRPYAMASVIPEPPNAGGFRFSDFMDSYYDAIKARFGSFGETFGILRGVYGDIFSPSGVQTAVELIGSILNREITPQHKAPFDEVVAETRGLLSGVQHKGHEFIARTPGFDMFTLEERQTMLDDTCTESFLITDGLMWDHDRLCFLFADKKTHINGYGVRALFDQKFLDFAFEFGSHLIALEIHQIATFILLAAVVFRPGGPNVDNTGLLGFLHAYYLDLLLHTMSSRQNDGFSQTVFVRHLGELFALINRNPNVTERCKSIVKDVPPLFYFCHCSESSVRVP